MPGLIRDFKGLRQRRWGCVAAGRRVAGVKGVKGSCVAYALEDLLSVEAPCPDCAGRAGDVIGRNGPCGG